MQKLFSVPVMRGRNNEQFAEILLRCDKKMEGTQYSHDLPIPNFSFINIKVKLDTLSKSNVLARLGALENTLDDLQNVSSFAGLDRHILLLSTVNSLGQLRVEGLVSGNLN